ncbi:MAG: lysophospholipid acyltransferase family protein [Coprobacter sp.]|nr:lysophospholipid acyltransferase family protein [Coprobacter sp.]
MKKETWENICYAPLYGFFKLHALLPLCVLYVLSDILFFPLFYIVRYRRKMVFRNMRNAFPEKSVAEIRRLEKDFYHHFCDYIVETIKLLHISDEEMHRRMQFYGMEQLDKVTAAGRSCLVYLGHYGNWEWIPSVTLWSQTPQVLFAQIYRPLKNRWFDRFFLNLRSRFHSCGIAKQDTLREIIRFRNSGQITVTGFMADQTPSPANIHFWMTFLNQDTPVLTGVEKIARKVDSAVFYFDVEKVRRGYYTATVREVCLCPKESAEFEITRRYMELMQTTIERNPAGWLWTHDRWKHSYLKHK